jgi:hypothetical protein
MAKRSSRSSSSSSSRPRGYSKSYDESRVERATWALLVLAFAVFEFVPDASLPNWFIPASGAIILLGSGMYQYSRHWRVSPITWISGSLLLFFTLYNIYMNPLANLLGLTLVVFAGVIIFGLITNET